jgi:hypothetical protein
MTEDDEWERIEREIKQRQAPPVKLTVTYSIKLSRDQRVKLAKLGGPKWIRAMIDGASK